MKRLIALIIILLAIFGFLLFKSKALLIYRVTEVREGNMHTSRKVFFDWETFLDYLKDIPDKVTGRVFSKGVKAVGDIKLTDREQESIGEIIKDAGVLTDKIEDKEIAEEIKKLMENYKGMDGLMEELEQK